MKIKYLNLSNQVKGIGNWEFEVRFDMPCYNQGKLMVHVVLNRKGYHRYYESIIRIVQLAKRPYVDLSQVLPEYALNYCAEYGVSTGVFLD